MRVYLFGNPGAGPALQERYRRMAEVLATAGAHLNANFLPTVSVGDDAAFMERVDAVVIEGSDPAPEAGHLVALALAYRKPVLYLTERGKPVDRHLRKLQENKAAGALLRLEAYAPDRLLVRLQEFFKVVERGESVTSPTIKFTLRLTPAIDRYLTYKTQGTKKSKADLLRELIEKLMADDAPYRQARVSPPPPK